MFARSLCQTKALLHIIDVKAGFKILNIVGPTYSIDRIDKNHHFSLSGWQRSLNYRHLTKYFGQ